jgi:hypothetical protein
MFPTATHQEQFYQIKVFDLHNNDRIVKWKEFRQQLEHSQDPYNDVAKFWGRAPFVNDYLNPFDETSWPNPWQLVMYSRLDTLAISLGMLYTFKLTERFKNSDIKIYMTSIPDRCFPVVVNNNYVLNWSYNEVETCDILKDKNTVLIYSKLDQV